MLRRWRRFWGLGLFVIWLVIGLGYCPVKANPTLLHSQALSGQQLSQQGSNEHGANHLPSERPVNVKVGIFVYDFGEINQVLQKYHLNTVIWLVWRDPRLAFTPTTPAEDSRVVPLQSIWSPDVEVVNSANFELPTDGNVFVEPDGTVTYIRKFSLQLSSELNLVKFPFDRQALKLILESGDYDASQVVFTVDDRPSQWRKEAFISEWKLETITQTVLTSPLAPDSEDYSQARFEIHIQRRAGFYLWRAFLPLLLIVGVAWLSLWVPLFNVPTGPFPLSIGALLTAITFNLSINSTLPRVSYLTFFDAFFLISCISIFLTLAVNVYLTKIYDAKQRNFEHLRRLLRRAIPISFIVSLVIIVLIFLI